MLYVLTADLKPGQLAEFHSWAHEAEKRFASAAPKGWRFKGIYLTSFGLGPAGSEIHWEVDNYAAFDSAVETHRTNKEYARVVAEYYGHVESSTQRARVLRSVGDERVELVRHAAAALAL